MKKVSMGIFIILALAVLSPISGHAIQKDKGTYTIDASGSVASKKDKKPKVEKIKKEKKSKKWS